MLDHFRLTYGEKILSAPTTTGFNIVAWVTPFAAIFVAAAMVVIVGRRWRKPHDAPTARDADARRRRARGGAPCRARGRAPALRRVSALLYTAGLALIGVIATFVAAPLLRGVAASNGGPPADPERYRLEKEKDLAYSAIKEAEFDFQMGKLSADDYAALRAKYEARALRALAALDQLR